MLENLEIFLKKLDLNNMCPKIWYDRKSWKFLYNLREVNATSLFHTSPSQLQYRAMGRSSRRRPRPPVGSGVPSWGSQAGPGVQIARSRGGYPQKTGSLNDQDQQAQAGVGL